MKMYWEACALLGGTCNKKKTCSGAYQISLCSDGLYMLLIGEYSIKLLPTQIQNICVVLLCEPRTSRHADGCRDFSAVRTRPAEGDRRTRNDMNQWAKEWEAGCSWMCCWVGGRLGDGEGDGGPQRALLSSLQGLCSTELICCEMCKHCLDWCLVCTGDWKEE